MERGADPGVGVRRLRNVARPEPFAAVLGALRGCYAEATPLEAFVRRLREAGTREVEVLRGDDAQCYRTFVSQCVVCVPRGARAIRRPICFQQVGRRESGRTVPRARGWPRRQRRGCGALLAPRACLRAPLPSGRPSARGPVRTTPSPVPREGWRSAEGVRAAVGSKICMSGARGLVWSDEPAWLVRATVREVPPSPVRGVGESRATRRETSCASLPCGF